MKRLLILFAAILLGAALFIFIQIPSESKIKGCFTTSMYNVDFCAKNKNYVPLKQISSYLQRAIILTEDSAFYTHEGFDSEGIEKCIEKIKEKKRLVCGGSTITQQLAKNLFLSADKSFVRKGLEALITMKLEKTLTKKEILEKYLNVVQFGKNIFGVKQAAQFYFKKHPSQLDVVESAFLAMVLPNPEKYSKSYFKKDLTKFARKRLTRIIGDMYKYKSIDEERYVSAMAKLDSFFQSGQDSVEKVDDLTLEDLDEMSEE